MKKLIMIGSILLATIFLAGCLQKTVNQLPTTESNYTVHFKIFNILNDQAVDSAKIVLDEIVGCPALEGYDCPKKVWALYTNAEGGVTFREVNYPASFGVIVEKDGFKSYSDAFVLEEKETTKMIKLLPSYAKIQSREDAWTAAKQDERVIEWLRRYNKSNSEMPAMFDNGKTWTISSQAFKPCSSGANSLCPGNLLEVVINTKTGEIIEVNEMSR